MEKLSQKQQEFIDAVEAGKNIFLTGKAGTGKSTVVKEAISLLKKYSKNVVALAPTGIAATNIEGQTIHSMYGLQPFGVLTKETCKFLKTEKRRLLDSIHVLFIDEVSMLRPDMLDAIDFTLVKNKCKSLVKIQVIFIGDLKQLPPPIDDNFRSVLMETYKGDQFYHAQIFHKLNVQTIELDEVHRQKNDDFIKALNIVRDGGKSDYFKQFVTTLPAGIVLAPHNSTVSQYNHDGLAAVEGQEYEFKAIVSGNAKADEFNLENLVRVKHGCKVMYCVNSKNNKLINGTLGTFVVKPTGFFINVDSVDYALEVVTCEKKEYVLNRATKKLELEEIGTITQMPIKLAYALTIHKSQGLTFDEVTVDISLPCFQKGQLYTALSRVRTPEGLRIIVNR